MKKRIAFLFLTIFLISGCVKTNVMDDLALAIAIGYDIEKEEQIRTTSVLLKIDPSAREQTQVVASTAMTSKGGRISSNRELSKNLVGGQARVVIYGKELAQQGVMGIADTLSRDPSLGHMIYLSVSDDTADSVLTHRYPELSNVGIYLYEMIKQNMEIGQFTSPTLHDFLRDYFSAGKDPAIPLVKRKGDEISLKGIAMFHEDKLAGVASPSESFLLKLLRKQKRPGLYEVILDSEPLTPYIKQNKKKQLKMVILATGFKSKIKLVNPKEPEFTVSLSIRADLQEISSSVDFQKPEALHVLQEEISHKINGEMEAFIARMQEIESDVAGFGEVYRSSVRNSELTKEKWHSMFKTARIHVKTDVKLLRTGVIE